MHKPFTVSKKSVLALPAPEVAPAADKPSRPVNMDRLADLSKPKPKKEDPTLRTGPAPMKRMPPRINSQSRLLQQRAKRLQEQRKVDREGEILAVTQGPTFKKQQEQKIVPRRPTLGYRKGHK